MARWTTRDVVGLAPDARAVQAARKLARPGPWSELGATDALVWGRCQGSGATPYQVSVDLASGTVRCSCPSRKLPCKHGLALLLLWVEGDGQVADVGDAAVPGFAAGPPARPRGRTSAGGDPGAAGTARAEPADPTAAARRLEQRLALMTAGMEELDRWLGDLLRQGLAAARRQPYGFWDQAAARLVDAQLPGLAERVREAGGDVHRGEGWAERLLAELGTLFLAARAWARRDQLDEATLGDLRAVVGWPVPTAEVRAGTRHRDRWVVLGVHRTLDGRLQAQRTWLRGEASGRTVRLLDFAAAGGTLAVPQVTGAVIEAELGLYPGGEPRRALFVDEPTAAAGPVPLRAVATLEEALAGAAGALAANPWARRHPVALAGATVVVRDRETAVVDAAGHGLPLVEEAAPWDLLARTGGRPTTVFGEWDGARFLPLSAVADGALVAV